MSQPARHTLVILDGGMEGLVALACAIEAAMPSGGVLACCVEPCELRQSAARSHAKRSGTAWHAAAPSTGSPSADLLALGQAAMGLGVSSIVWPVRAQPGPRQVHDAAVALDRALLVGRLLSLEASGQGVPEVRVETPLVDLDDEQLAELAADLGVPIEACWWWGSSGGAAGSERARWMDALRPYGITGAASASA